MAKNSSIEWTHHTFNPWWGCAKVSPACQHCYAETWAKRVGQPVWGKNSPRRFFGESHWKEPIRWNAEATATGQRRRVFCASMADVFEKRTDLKPWREKLWELIIATPMLDWLLLTKRPENIEKMVPWTKDWPANIWLGTTVESQKYADERLPHLLKHRSKVRFLSCEPLLGEINLTVFAKAEFNPHSRPRTEPDRLNFLSVNRSPQHLPHQDSCENPSPLTQPSNTQKKSIPASPSNVVPSVPFVGKRSPPPLLSDVKNASSIKDSPKDQEADLSNRPKSQIELATTRHS